MLSQQVRKIRCDGLPGGCSPCMQNRTECRTTDRISQRAMPRGYVENLEAKVNLLEEKIKELEASLALERSSRRPKPGVLVNQSGHKRGGPNAPFNPDVASRAGTFGRNSKPYSQVRLGNPPEDDKIRGFRSGGYYLGLSSGASTIHSMRDSALSVLGIEIDLSDVDPTDTSHPNIEDGIGESYASCLASIFNANPSAPQNLELPLKADCMGCAEWFFAFSYSYLPVVHRQTFMKQVRIYTLAIFHSTHPCF